MHHVKRRKNILKKTKGFEAGRKKLIKLAQTAAKKAGAHSYRDRKVKKRLNRGLWEVKVNAGARKSGTTYSALMGAMKKKGVILDRKVLSQIAELYPEVFKKIVETVIK